MPSLVPSNDNERDVNPLYFVLCDYGKKVGRAYVETAPDEADKERIIQLLIAGEYTRPVQILAVDLAAGKAWDASPEMADSILERTRLDDLPSDTGNFVSLRARHAIC